MYITLYYTYSAVALKEILIWINLQCKNQTGLMFYLSDHLLPKINADS